MEDTLFKTEKANATSEELHLRCNKLERHINLLHEDIDRNRQMLSDQNELLLQLILMTKGMLKQREAETHSRHMVEMFAKMVKIIDLEHPQFKFMGKGYVNLD